MGDVEAHLRLAILYSEAYCVEGVEKDEVKYIYHLEEAAIGGHPTARYMLGVEEMNNCYILSTKTIETDTRLDANVIERAVNHFIIAATQGHDDSMKKLMDAFRRGLVIKEDLATTLRAHKAAVDATKSPEREAAEKESTDSSSL